MRRAMPIDPSCRDDQNPTRKDFGLKCPLSAKLPLLTCHLPSPTCRWSMIILLNGMSVYNRVRLVRHSCAELIISVRNSSQYCGRGGCLGGSRGQQGRCCVRCHVFFIVPGRSCGRNRRCDVRNHGRNIPFGPQTQPSLCLRN